MYIKYAFFYTCKILSFVLCVCKNKCMGFKAPSLQCKTDYIIKHKNAPRSNVTGYLIRLR